MKNELESFINGVDQMEERISELENRNLRSNSGGRRGRTES